MIAGRNFQESLITVAGSGALLARVAWTAGSIESQIAGGAPIINDDGRFDIHRDGPRGDRFAFVVASL